MNCDEKNLEAFLNNELTETQGKQLDEHIATCDKCRRYIAESQSLNIVLQAYQREAADHSLLCSLSQIQYQTKKKFSLFNLLPQELALATFSILVALCFGAFIGTMAINTNPDYFAQEQDILEQISLASLINF